MHRAVEVRVDVVDFDPERREAIECTLRRILGGPVADVEDGISMTMVIQIPGCETEESFARSIAYAVNWSNGCECDVNIVITDIENAPFQRFTLLGLLEKDSSLPPCRRCKMIPVDTQDLTPAPNRAGVCEWCWEKMSEEERDEALSSGETTETWEVTVKMNITFPKNLEGGADKVLEDMDYDFSATDIGCDIDNTEIVDWEKIG